MLVTLGAEGSSASTAREYAKVCAMSDAATAVTVTASRSSSQYERSTEKTAALVQPAPAHTMSIRRRAIRPSESRPRTVETTMPATGAASRNSDSSTGLACTALVRNSDRNGNHKAVDSPKARNTAASGARARDRMRNAGRVVVAVTASN